MKNLINTYQQLLNLQNAIFLRIDHEDAIVAVVYKITKSNGEQLILKIYDRSNDYLREVHFLTYQIFFYYARIINYTRSR